MPRFPAYLSKHLETVGRSRKARRAPEPSHNATRNISYVPVTSTETYVFDWGTGFYESAPIAQGSERPPYKRVTSGSTPARSTEAPFCEVHQHYKWCQHNGGILGKTGYEPPRNTMIRYRTFKGYKGQRLTSTWSIALYDEESIKAYVKTHSHKWNKDNLADFFNYYPDGNVLNSDYFWVIEVIEEPEENEWGKVSL